VEKDKLHLTNGDCLLFSVLIANYNNGKYLMDAINSVRSQIYTNWELTLVDDGSTDNSHDLYQEFEQDERIHVYLNDCNHGCGYSKRRCVELANGEYCGFLDPDDMLLPNAIEISINNLLNHPDSVLSFSRYIDCDDEMNKIGECRLLELMSGESYLEHHDYGPEHFAVFRRTAYLKTSGINKHLHAAVDQDLYFKLEEVGSISVIDSFTYKYRHSTTSISKNDRIGYYWNFIVRHEACERRNLKIDNLVWKDYNDFLNSEVERGKSFVRVSKTYKMGRLITKLFKR